MNRSQKQLLRKQQLEPLYKERALILLRDGALILDNIQSYNQCWNFHYWLMEYFLKTPFIVKVETIHYLDKYRFKLKKK